MANVLMAEVLMLNMLMRNVLMNLRHAAGDATRPRSAAVR